MGNCVTIGLEGKGKENAEKVGSGSGIGRFLHMRKP